MDGESEITSATEIASIINQLIQNRELLKASYSAGRGSITTLLLAADREKGTLVFDGSNDDNVNRQIISASKLSFSGAVSGTKVSFTCAGIREVSHKGSPALSTRFPGSLMRFQNRESFRVKAAETFCLLSVPRAGIAKVPVVELSVGGVLLRVNSLAENFTPGQQVGGCSIELGSAGRLACTLEVRAIKKLGPGNWGLGCRFVGLSKASEASIARYVTQLEKKSGGGRGLFSL